MGAGDSTTNLQTLRVNILKTPCLHSEMLRFLFTFDSTDCTVIMTEGHGSYEIMNPQRPEICLIHDYISKKIQKATVPGAKVQQIFANTAYQWVLLASQ